MNYRELLRALRNSYSYWYHQQRMLHGDPKKSSLAHDTIRY